jgi:hypothetical protein
VRCFAELGLPARGGPSTTKGIYYESRFEFAHITHQLHSGFYIPRERRVQPTTGKLIGVPVPPPRKDAHGAAGTCRCITLLRVGEVLEETPLGPMI